MVKWPMQSDAVDAVFHRTTDYSLR